MILQKEHNGLVLTGDQIDYQLLNDQLLIVLFAADAKEFIIK